MPADPGHETEAGSSETSRLSNLGIGLLLLGVLLPQINYFGVNVALNTIRRSLGASPADLELIVAGYGTAYAIFLVIGGRLGDRYGRRRVFTIGLIGFLVASLGCGLAPSAILLVVFRILQGALGAATITVERRAERRGLVSLLPPSVLGLSSVRRGLSLHLPFMLGYGAFMFVFALVLQQGLHADPLTAGWPRCRWQCRSSSPRRGARRPDRDHLALWPHVGLLIMAPSHAVIGTGQALVFGSLFLLILAEVPEHHAGTGSGVLVTVQQAGLALGVATLGTLYTALNSHGTAEPSPSLPASRS